MAVYRAPSTNKNDFLNKFEEIISLYKNTYIIGDFNLDLLKKNDTCIQRYLDILNSFGFAILNRISRAYATRIQTVQEKTTKTVIDHISTNILSATYYFSVHDFCKSDHRILILNIMMSKNIPSVTVPQRKTFLLYKNINKIDFERNAALAHTFNDLINTCKNTISNNTRISENNLSLVNKSPWINNKIKLLTKKRDKWYRLKVKYPENGFILNKFKYYKTNCKKAMQESQMRYFEQALGNNDYRAVWHLLNEHVFNKSKPKKKIILKHDSSVIEDQKEICYLFNEYFINCANISNNTTINQSNIIPMENTPIEINTPFKFALTDFIEVENIIENLNKKSAVGYDDVSTKFCVFFKSQLSHIIAHLINNSIQRGNFPTSLKIAKIMPIFKSGSNIAMENYRPIAILTVFSKIFEKIIYTRLEAHLVINHVLNKNQFGFVSGTSTLAATSQVVTDIKYNLDRGHLTSCLFIDLKKAFDSVNHAILIKKLEHLGINNIHLKLFESYLFHRKQFVKLDNTHSDIALIKQGVPQGSLIAPILFNIYTNDIFTVQLNGNLVMYADDMVIIYKAKNINDLQDQMQTDLVVLNSWMIKNSLKINESKTKFIIFQIKNKLTTLSDFRLQINGQSLERVTQFKYLGLWIDNKLNWHQHISAVKDTIRKMNFVLYQLRHVVPIKIKYMIFHSHIMSAIRYLLPVWGRAAKFRMFEIHTLLNKTLKIIKNLPPRTPSSLLYGDNILPLEKLIAFEEILFIYKIKNNLIKTNFQFNTINSLHNYGTRQAENFYTDAYRTSGGKNNLIYRGLCLFNKLSEELKNEAKITTFIGHLKQYILSNI